MHHQPCSTCGKTKSGVNLRPTAFTQFDDTVALDPAAARSGWYQLLTGLLRKVGVLKLAFVQTPQRRAWLGAGEATTLPPPSRGQTLRDAHRTLRQLMRNHPAIRQVMPHLSVIERSLAKRGSAALRRLPVGVLQRGLEQLAVLQGGEHDRHEAMNLRVLRFRLAEAITARSNMPYVWGVNHDTQPGRRPEIALGSDSLSGVSLSDCAPSETGGLASEATTSMFDDLDRFSRSPSPPGGPRSRRSFRY